MALGSEREDLADDDVAGGVLFAQCVKRRPAADVGPTWIDWRHNDIFSAFHHGIVDRIGRAGQKGLSGGVNQPALLLSANHRGGAGLRHSGLLPLQFIQKAVGAPQEGAGLPRPAQRSVGQEWVSTVRSWWSSIH